METTNNQYKNAYKLKKNKGQASVSSTIVFWHLKALLPIEICNKTVVFFKWSHYTSIQRL